MVNRISRTSGGWRRNRENDGNPKRMLVIDDMQDLTSKQSVTKFGSEQESSDEENGTLHGNSIPLKYFFFIASLFPPTQLLGFMFDANLLPYDYSTEK